MKEVQPRLMTTRDTAIYLSVSEAALKAWRLRGGGPPWIKVGHAVRYDLQSETSLRLLAVGWPLTAVRYRLLVAL